MQPVLKLLMLFCMLTVMNTQELTTQQANIGGSDFDLDQTVYLFNRLNRLDLDYDAFYYAFNGYKVLENKGLVNNDHLVAIIDFSLPSTEKRFYIIDIIQQCVVSTSLVAHGKNSGENYATMFSNRMGSHKSSLGFFTTGSTYYGQNGYSLVLNGLDTAFNEKAGPRAIVIHGATYVSGEYIHKYGRLGRSFGCPALPVESCHEMINLIKNGVMIFGYYPDAEYFKKSWIINEIVKSEV